VEALTDSSLPLRCCRRRLGDCGSFAFERLDLVRQAAAPRMEAEQHALSSFAREPELAALWCIAVPFARHENAVLGLLENLVLDYPDPVEESGDALVSFQRAREPRQRLSPLRRRPRPRRRYSPRRQEHVE
jgi:hypothetical protein